MHAAARGGDAERRSGAATCAPQLGAVVAAEDGWGRRARGCALTAERAAGEELRTSREGEGEGEGEGVRDTHKVSRPLPFGGVGTHGSTA